MTAVRRASVLAWAALMLTACGAATAAGPPGGELAAAPPLGAIEAATVRVYALTAVRLKPGTERAEGAVPSADLGVREATGAVVHRRGLVATTAEAVEHARHLIVLLPGDPTPIPASIVEGTQDPRFALLAVARRLPASIPIPPEPHAPKKGDAVAAMGYPTEGAPPEPSRGAISGVDPHDTLELTLTPNGGNVGGPLFDRLSRLIGIVFESEQEDGEAARALAAPAERLRLEVSRALGNGRFAAAQEAIANAGDDAARAISLARESELDALDEEARRRSADAGPMPELARLSAIIDGSRDPALLVFVAGVCFNAARTTFALGRPAAYPHVGSVRRRLSHEVRRALDKATSLDRNVREAPFVRAVEAYHRGLPIPPDIAATLAEESDPRTHERAAAGADPSPTSPPSEDAEHAEAAAPLEAAISAPARVGT